MPDPDLRTWDAWRNVHQPFEIGWWRTAIAEGHTGLDPKLDEFKEFIEPVGDILEIGCGPHPAYAPCTVIDPLALDYQEITPLEWWQDVMAYNQPAEWRVGGLRADTIICWNTLDHAIGWRDILDNMLVYGRGGARFAVATDFWPEPFDGHPGFDRDEFMAEIDKRFVILKQREPLGRDLALLMSAK